MQEISIKSLLIFIKSSIVQFLSTFLTNCIALLQGYKVLGSIMQLGT